MDIDLDKLFISLDAADEACCCRPRRFDLRHHHRAFVGIVLLIMTVTLVAVICACSR